MPNVFRDPCNCHRRLISVAFKATGDWNCLRDYWARTTPNPGYKPVDYPGLPMKTEEYQKALEEAQKYLGNSYLWGGKVPPYFDCSGYVSWCYKIGGIFENSGLGTDAIFELCEKVEESESFQGDLCFWGIHTGSAHVAIYIGNGYILDSSGGGVGYHLRSYHDSVVTFNGYYRVIGHNPKGEL